MTPAEEAEKQFKHLEARGYIVERQDDGATIRKPDGTGTIVAVANQTIYSLLVPGRPPLFVDPRQIADRVSQFLR